MGFWKDRRVLVTGHTGFKGAWLALWLHELGAQVSGLALPPATRPALFDLLELAELVDHGTGDIRDPETVQARVNKVQPEFVFHLAAQPLVLASYQEPVTTWHTNVLGTVHLLEALREIAQPCVAVIVTTDKVYLNQETDTPFAEQDRLGGHDPYAASKAGCELAVASYQQSFFNDSPVKIVSARAGNVIGGGDWAADRILPDAIRYLQRGEAIRVRNPAAKRPWQHVLEPLSGYLRLAQQMHATDSVGEAYNFGPEAEAVRPVRELVEGVLALWHGSPRHGDPSHGNLRQGNPRQDDPGQCDSGQGKQQPDKCADGDTGKNPHSGWVDCSDPQAPHEARLLSLDIRRAAEELSYRPRWHFDTGLEKTVAWYRAVQDGANPRAVTQAQIKEFGSP